MSDQGESSGEIQVGTATHSTTLMLYADMVVVGGGHGLMHRIHATQHNAEEGDPEQE